MGVLDHGPRPCSKCGADKNGYGHRAYCQNCWREYQREYWIKRQARLPAVPTQNCDHCGVEFQPSSRRKGVRFCSPECHDRYGKFLSKQQRLQDKQTILGDRRCPHCGTAIDQSERSDQKFCSRKCSSAAHQLKRRLRSNGYLRLQIAERDRWICGICHKPIDASVQHPDPNYGSLDHIVPRSRGGSHEPRNLRITHLRCNISRKTRFDPAELSLTPRDLHDLKATLFDD